MTPRRLNPHTPHTPLLKGHVTWPSPPLLTRHAFFIDRRPLHSGHDRARAAGPFPTTSGRTLEVFEMAAGSDRLPDESSWPMLSPS